MSEYSLKPGVVTGKEYETLVEAAKSGGYALPAVNIVGTNSMNAVMEAAAKANLNEGAARVAVHRLRKRYRELLREEIAQTLSDPADLDEELRALFRAFGD